MTRLLKFCLGIFVAAFLCLGAWAENPDHVQQARDTGSCPSCDLSGAYLKQLEANAGDFSSASFQNTNLRYSSLQAASFAGADLTGADLTGANLALADLIGANLAGVITDEQTVCPDNSPGPCSFGGD